jgi:hypothetical protein
VAVFEAPDDVTMTAFSLSVAKLGNVKTQTLRAFSNNMSAILGKWCNGQEGLIATPSLRQHHRHPAGATSTVLVL